MTAQQEFLAGHDMNNIGGFIDQTVKELEDRRLEKAKIKRAFRQGKYCDLKIHSSDKKEFQAHRLILSIANEWFNTKLEEDPDMTELKLDFKGDCIKLILDSVYGIRLKPEMIKKENAREMLLAGAQFHLDALQDEAARFMANNMCETYVIDMANCPVFTTHIKEIALRFVARRLQHFLDDDTLRGRLFKELKPSYMSFLLSERTLILTEPNGRYLAAIEREKRILDVLLDYVKEDKDTRLPSMKLLLKALKIPLLIGSEVFTVESMKEKLDVPEDKLKEIIEDVSAPFSHIGPNENIATIITKSSKSSNTCYNQDELRDIARMRYATIPHVTACSDITISNRSDNQEKSRSNLAPGPVITKKAFVKDQFLTRLVICYDSTCSTASAPLNCDNDAAKDAAATSSTEGDKTTNSDDKSKEDPAATCSNGDKESPAKKGGKKAAKKNEEAGDKQTDSVNGDGHQENGSEKDGSTEESSAKANGSDETSAPKNGQSASDRQFVGLKLMYGDDASSSLGSCETNDKTETVTYDLEPGEWIVKIVFYANANGSTMNSMASGKGAKLEKFIQNRMQLKNIGDICFHTNKGRVLGGPQADESSTSVGISATLPRVISRLEKGLDAPCHYLQGFGMDEVHLTGADKSVKIFPIWGFVAAHKYYPVKYDGVEFLPGIKKCQQVTIAGLSEILELNSWEDLDNVERTPVGEVVDLGDSDDNLEFNQDHDDSDSDMQERTASHPQANGGLSMNDESVMVIDSDSDMEEDMEEEEDNEDEEEGDDEEDGEDDQNISKDGRQIAGGPSSFKGGLQETIEIGSSSDEDDDDNQDGDGQEEASSSSGGKKRPRGEEGDLATGGENGTAGRPKRSR